MTLETTPWDPVDHLTSPEAERAYLEAAFEDGGPALIAAVLGDIARARDDADRARGRDQPGGDAQGLRREGNPTLDTLTKVMKVLGLKLSVREAT